MAKYGSDDVSFWLVDGYSLAGLLADITLDGPEALLEETHGFGDSWVEQEPVGLYQWSASQNGWIDDATNASLDALSGQDGAERVMCFCVKGNAIGQSFDGLAGPFQMKHTKTLSRGALSKIAADFSGSGRYDEGLILHELSEETADGDTESSGVDNGASSSNGGAAYLQVTALDLGGYDDVTVRALHSADDVTYVAAATFTDVAAAPAAERVLDTGTINRYLASDWTFNGTGSGQSISFMVGYARH